MIKNVKNITRQDKEPYFVPKRVQGVIPISCVWPDGVFKVGAKFSKTYRFTDINYMVASREDKEGMFLTYSELLNSLDSSATTKLTISNHRQNRGSFEESILMAMRGDGLDEYRKGAYLKRLILDDKERQLKGLQERPISFDPLTSDDCTPIDFSQEVRGKIAAVKPESLLPANRTADHQLVLVNGVVYGNTCSCVNLYSGKRVRWKPNEIIGEVKPEFLPNWAKDRYSVIEREKAMKESRGRDGR